MTMTKNELLTAIFNLYLYAESAVQFVTLQDMDKMISETYDADTLAKILQFIDESIDNEDLEEFMKQESIKQYLLNLEKVASCMKSLEIVDKINALDSAPITSLKEGEA